MVTCPNSAQAIDYKSFRISLNCASQWQASCSSV
jgi:hypothetical protein